MRASFDHLGEQYIELARTLTDDQLELPGLGQWNVRELLGHGLRAFSTAAANLDAAPTIEHAVHSAGDYYRTAFSDQRVHTDIAARGVTAGLALHDDLVGTVETTILEACARVGAAPDDAIVNHFVGQVPFVPYMATRVVEAAVHMLDLQRALGQKPSIDERTAGIVLLTLAEMDDPTTIILSVTGRADLPSGYNVLQ